MVDKIARLLDRASPLSQRDIVRSLKKLKCETIAQIDKAIVQAERKHRSAPKKTARIRPVGRHKCRK